MSLLKRVGKVFHDVGKNEMSLLFPIRQRRPLIVDVTILPGSEIVPSRDEEFGETERVL
jgi:hypothetical protein